MRGLFDGRHGRGLPSGRVTGLPPLNLLKGPGRRKDAPSSRFGRRRGGALRRGRTGLVGVAVRGQAHAMGELGFSGEVVDLYHRYRRGYPAAVIDAVVDEFELTRHDAV